MADLYLIVKEKYFNEIKSRKKTIDYRLYKTYWIQCIEGKKFNNVIIRCGYGKKKQLIFPYRGYSIQMIKHPEFGDNAVTVFAIPLEK
jgi:hypothetical protein